MIFLDVENSVAEMLEGFGMLRPPNQAGRVKSSLSKSLMAVLPVVAGRRRSLIASSSGLRILVILEVVLMRNDHSDPTSSYILLETFCCNLPINLGSWWLRIHQTGNCKTCLMSKMSNNLPAYTAG